MGTGVSFPVWSPEEVRCTVKHIALGFGLKLRVVGEDAGCGMRGAGSEKPNLHPSFLASRKRATHLSLDLVWNADWACTGIRASIGIPAPCIPNPASSFK